jgi:acetoin utilization deacetylase AcuC-like enzyme
MNISTIPVVYNNAYDIAVPPTHSFNGTKFSELLKCLYSSGFANKLDFIKSSPVRYRDILRSHASDYVRRVSTDTLLREEIRQINLPINNNLIKRSFLALNGTYKTALKALENSVACHAAGGTHHAHFSHGSGFCIFNDLAFTAVNLIEHGQVNNVLILDLDVHQGDGTIDICREKTGIYTCSLHCEQNYPFEKRKGTRDVALDRHLEDKAYLHQLHRTLNEVSEEFTPDIVLYDAGVDVFFGDKLGNLNLTLDGILKRDCHVLEHFKRRNIPIATVIGGGYDPSDIEIAKRHVSIFSAVNNVF